MKNFVLWAVIAVAVLVLFSQFMPRVGQAEEVRYSTFLDEVRNGRVEQVVLQGEQILGTRKDKTVFRVFNPETDYTALIGTLNKSGVGIEGRAPKQPNFLAQLVLQLAPALLLILVFVWMLRQMQGSAGGRGAMSFGKSRARLLGEDQVNVTFADVAGVDEAKQEVGEIVDFLKDPSKYQKLGGKIPKGVLMVGSPGTGKTLLARAIAGEAKRAVLHDLGFGLRRDDRRRRRLARARPLRAGQEARALHHLHRRDRRGRPPSRRPVSAAVTTSASRR